MAEPRLRTPLLTSPYTFAALLNPHAAHSQVPLTVLGALDLTAMLASP